MHAARLSNKEEFILFLFFAPFSFSMPYNSFMDKSSEKSFLRKIYFIIILILAILALLFYLILSGGSRRIQEAIDKGDSETSGPVVTADTEPSDQPENTKTPEASKNPDETRDPSPSADSTPSAEPDPTPTPTPEPTPSPTPEAVKDDIDSNDSLTKIVSPKRKIDASYVPKDLVQPHVASIDDENQNYLRKDAAKALEAMFAAAEKEGYHLYMISGYRSYEFQQKLYDWWVAQKGAAYAAELDAMPGGSEHQLGLAANIGTTDGKCELNVCFADTAAYAWLRDHAHEFGYIERYPSNKQNITGITWSPWNFRYVGTDAAKRIRESGKTMEEYYGL